jgi:large subunit ribosomal protein L9
MKLLLREAIDSLGRQGEIVTVRPGYARNYLLPRQLAVEVTATNLQVIEQEKRKIKIREVARVEEIKGLTANLEKVSCSIEVKANAEGHLYGSVSARDIVEAYKAEGFELDEKMIGLDKPIKETGVYSFTIQLHAEVAAEGKVWVVAEKSDGDAAEE